MTCIVGLVNNGKCYIGGDSAGVSGLDLRIRTDEKVFVKNNMVFGFTDSFQMGQILRYDFTIPDHDPRLDDLNYMCTEFTKKLIACFKEHEFATINSSQVLGGEFLIGYKGVLYHVFSDFQIARIDLPFDACGCGERYAIGAMAVMQESNIDPNDKITIALKIAEKFSAGVRSPFVIVNV